MPAPHEESIPGPLDCQDVQALLSALIDDELDAETRHLADRHVATCPDCREVLDELEYAETVLAADIDRICSDLPAGFEAAVLEETVCRDRRRRVRGLVTWSGWVATAASLTIATAALWWSDSPAGSEGDEYASSAGASDQADPTGGAAASSESSTGSASPGSVMPASYGTGWELRAFIDEDRVFERPVDESSEENFDASWDRRDRDRHAIELTPQPHSLIDGLDEYDPEDDASLLSDDEHRRQQRSHRRGDSDASPDSRSDDSSAPARTQDQSSDQSPDPTREQTHEESPEQASPHQQPSRPINRDDRETLYMTTILLEMLEDADTDTFVDVERIRRIAESDEILDRLAAARYRVPLEYRPAVMAAEGILLRAVNGPLSFEDLIDLQEASSRMDLPRQLDTIIERPSNAESL